MAKWTPTITRGETITVGFAAQARTGTEISIDGEAGLIDIAGTVWDLCNRCDACGDRPEYGNVFQGQCFGCGRSGLGRRYKSIEEAARVVHRRQLARARRAAKRQAKEDAERAAFAAWAEQHRELVDALTPYGDPGCICEFVDDRHSVACQQAGADHLNARLKWDQKLVDIATEVTASKRPLSDAQAAYARQLLGRQQEQVVKAARRRHAGQVGGTVAVTGTVVVRKEFESRFGYGVITVIEGAGDDEGVTVVTFSQAKAVANLERGDEVTITGTVKAHQERDEVPQTVLTRPTLG